MRIVLGFFVCVFSVIVLSATSVSAQEEEWASGEPPIVYSETMNFQWTPQCPTSYQYVAVREMGASTRVCLFGGSSPKIGVSFPDNGDIRLVVSYLFDSQFYPVNGGCEGVANCIYSPATDTLITRYYAVNHLSVKVYRHVKERIQRIVDPGTLQVRYQFDSSNPDFIFQNDQGYPLYAEALAVSESGQWLALEYRNMGVVRIDLQTFDTRRVLTSGLRHGYGTDPSVEMAISNDGSMLAVMGERAGLSVTRITENCGDRIRPIMYEYFESDEQRCPLVSVNISELTPYLYGAYDPQFNELGDRVYFTVVDGYGIARRVGIEAHGSSRSSQISYLALGDSFTSGEGEMDDQYYLVGTNEKFEKCHVSSRSYPFLLAHLLGVSEGKNIACSGAKMTDITDGSVEYWGQGGRLGQHGRRLDLASLAHIQSGALDGFSQGRIPQQRFVQRYEPGLVTVGIGGNDAGLMTKLRACVMPGMCEWAASSEGLYKTAMEIRGLFGRLVDMYQGLVRLSPTSKIIAVGYPQIIEPDGVCDPVTALMLEKDERRFIKESIQYLNEIIWQASKQAGIGYFDASEVFRGHELCTGSSDAMNGLRFGDDMKLGSILPVELLGNESFHPTPYGHGLIASRLATYYTSNSNLHCNGCPGMIPPTPLYWGYDLSSVMPRVTDFAYPTEVSPDVRSVTIALPEKSISPYSQVRVEIHSTRREIGELQSDESGGLSGTVTIPIDIEKGIHTIHLYTTAYSGEEVELYQEIVYRDAAKGAEDSPFILIGGQAGDVVESVVDGGSVRVFTELFSSLSPQSAAVLGLTDTKKAQRVVTLGWVVYIALAFIILSLIVLIVIIVQRVRGSHPP